MIPAAETTVVRSANRMKALDVQGRELPSVEPLSDDVRVIQNKLELDK